MTRGYQVSVSRTSGGQIGCFDHFAKVDQDIGLIKFPDLTLFYGRVDGGKLQKPTKFIQFSAAKRLAAFAIQPYRRGSCR